MKVISLQTKNTKGRDLDEELTGREIYVGANCSGKSTRLQSLTILLQGFLSSLGKSNISNMDLASDKFLSVSGTLDDKFSFARKYRRKSTNHGDGTKTFACTADYTVFPDGGETKTKDRLDRITNHVGSFSVMFDLKEFLAMSDAAKRKFIFELSSPEVLGWNLDRIVDSLDTDKKKRVRDWWMPDDSIADNLSTMLSNIGKEITDNAAVLKNKSKARDELVGPRQDAMEGEQGDVKEIHEEKDRLRKEKSDHEKAIAEANAAKTSREQLQKQIDAAQARRLELEGEEVTSTAEELVVDTMHNDLEIERVEAQSLREVARGVTEELEACRTATSDAVDAKNIKGRLIKETQAGASNIRDKVIPTVKRVCKVLGEDGIAIVIKTLEEHCDKEDTTVEEAKVEYDALVSDYEAKSKAQQEVAGKQREAERAYGRAEDDISLAEPELARARHSVESAKSKIESRSAEVNRLKTQEGELSESLKSLPTPPSMAMVESLITALEGQIEQLEERHKKAIETQQLMKQFDALVAEIQDLEDLVENTKLFRDQLGAKGIQAQIMAEVMDPIQSTVNELLGKITDDNDVNYEAEFTLLDHNGKEIFAIHRVVGDARIPYNALSGGEAILFGTALMIALIRLKNPPLKALCIEAAELDSTNFVKLISALNVIAGEIDNIMVASCSDHVLDVVKKGESDALKAWNSVQL